MIKCTVNIIYILMSNKISCNVFLTNTSRQPFSVMLHINNNNPQSTIFITIDVHVGLHTLAIDYSCSNLLVSIVSVCHGPFNVDRIKFTELGVSPL